MQETFDIVPVFRRSLSVFWRRAPALLGLGVLAQVPVLAYSVSDNADLDNPGDEIRMLSLVLSMLMLGAVCFATIRDLKGGHASFLRSLHEAITNMFPLLGVGLLLGVFPLFLSYDPTFLTVLILPWVLLTTLLYAAIPAIMDEQVGVRASVVRSAQLTKGRRWRILAILVLLGLAKIAAVSILSKVPSGDQDAMALLAHLLVDLFIEVYAAVVAGVSYMMLLRSYRAG